MNEVKLFMRSVRAAIVVTLTLVGHDSGAQNAERQIRALEEQWRLASLHADTALFHHLMTPDHYAIRTDGVVTSPDDRLRDFASGDVKTVSLNYSDVRVRVYGSAAVVTGLAARKDTVLRAGRPTARDFQYRYVRVWTRTEKGWQCAVFSSTTVNPGRVGGLPPTASTDTAAIAALDWHRFQAVQRKDIAALDTLLGDDWVASGSTPRVLTKTEYLSALASGTRSYGDIHHDDVRVRVVGDVAVITGRSTGPHRIDGRDMNSSVRFTHIYARRGGRWVMIGMHTSTVTPQ